MWSESSLIVSIGLGKHDLPFANTVSKDVCTSAEARRELVFTLPQAPSPKTTSFRGT